MTQSLLKRSTKETQAMTETLADAPFTIADGPQRHARYAALAAVAPVHRIALPTGHPAWLITGYDEVRHALHDPRLIKNEAAQATLSRDRLSPEVFAAMGSHMLNRNPPDHTRLRRLVTAAFTRRRIEQLAPLIQQITDELLDAMANEAQTDLIDSFALPLPITVICELIGVPADRRADHVGWHTGRPGRVLLGCDRDGAIPAGTAQDQEHRSRR
jgi:cytochrome P450